MDRFALDYGRLPMSFLKKENVTNAWELLQGAELVSLLRLCGKREEEIGENASDYERFRALCSVFPMLHLYPPASQITAFLQTYFPQLPQPSPNTCDLLWKGIAEKIELHAYTAMDFLPSDIACLTGFEDLDTVCGRLRPMVDANSLLYRSADSLESWRKTLIQTMETARTAGGDAIRLVLDADFVFRVPDVYHVTQALATRERTANEHALLICQLFRELCVLCKECAMRLLLEVECPAQQARALLSYAERAVGLPVLVWTCCVERARPLIDFQVSTAHNEMYWALHTADAPSQGELLSALEAAGARYPLGRLLLVCGTDLRGSAYARINAENAMKKCLEKSEK